LFVRKINLAILFLLGIASCVQINLTTSVISVSNINKTNDLIVNFKIKKFTYSTIDSTFYLMDENQKIHILRNGEVKNIIGGIGFSTGQFRELTDFCIDKNGHLLTLDRMRKKLIVFDSLGNPISEMDISFINYPLLIAQLDSGYFVSYDNTTKEAVVFPEWETNDVQRFGQFDINSPEYIRTNLNNIIFYDRQSNTTLIYDDFGNLLQQKKGKFLVDKFNNYYKFTEHFIIQDSIKCVSVRNIKLFDIFETEILVAENNKIGIFKIKYEK